MDRALHVGILAGEASGDLLGAGLMQVLRARNPGITFSGIGGPGMIAAGLDSMVPMDRLSVMGLTEPLKRLPELLRIRRNVYRHMQATRPDVFIGIDSPDFNLGLEMKIRALGIPTVHYVSPSVWAWRQGRVHKIRKAVDLVLSLFPFEEDFLRRHEVNACCVGHPLADILPQDPDVAAARAELGLTGDASVLAILPGSRGGEVARLCPVFLDTFELCRRQNPGLRGVIPCAGPLRRQQVETFLSGHATASARGRALTDRHDRRQRRIDGLRYGNAGSHAAEKAHGGCLQNGPAVLRYHLAHAEIPLCFVAQPAGRQASGTRTPPGSGSAAATGIRGQQALGSWCRNGRHGEYISCTTHAIAAGSQ